MDRLLVYANFDWLDAEELVGTLYHERLRGTDKYGFEYDTGWLRRHPDISFGADIMNYASVQWSASGKDIFGCFSDMMPDQWGRTLMMRREQLAARDEQRVVRQLSSYDYLTGVSDFTRLGGLRLKNENGDGYVMSATPLSVPPLANVRELIYAAGQIEQSEERSELPEAKWLRQLMNPGSSLGGARPKANVQDGGQLYIAKFPSRKDTYDVELWEHLCHLLAFRVGVLTAETSLLNVGTGFHTLLSKRFDRRGDTRIHFASAMTMLGLTDGCDANTGHGYLDMVDFIVQSCVDVERNLKELFRRVAFYICIGNSDDHFRNHGFILTKGGWTLAPAYDINPTLNTYQGLLISRNSNEANLNVLLDACEDYMLRRSDAENIVEEVRSGMADWASLAARLQIRKGEMALFADRINRFCVKV